MDTYVSAGRAGHTGRCRKIGMRLDDCALAGVTRPTLVSQGAVGGNSVSVFQVSIAAEGNLEV